MVPKWKERFRLAFKQRSGDDKGIVEGNIKIGSVVLKLSSSVVP